VTARSHRNRRPHRLRIRRGFSLAECVFSLLLTSVVIVGALNAVSATHRTRTQVQTQRQATELARQLLTEIMQCYYVDPGSSPVFGPETDESTGNRSLFDDVDDYANWSESPPRDKNGTALSGFTGWSRAATVVWVTPATPDRHGVGTDTGLKRITVTVTDPSSKATTLYGFRSEKGIGEQKPASTTTFVEWVGVAITAGSSNTTMSTSVNLTNGAQ
jgi:type II secretory pathway pseudopilin PulG